MLSRRTLSCAFLLTNIVCAFWIAYHDKGKEYTFVGEDYPVELPIAHQLPLAALSLQESVHYNLNNSDPVSEEEWISIISHPFGLGRVHLGPNNRLFNNVFWHQLHCIREMDRAMKNRQDPHATPAHIRHCLNYLRQSFLCDADYALEWGDIMQRDFDQQRLEDTRVCRDWDVVFHHLENSMLKWAKN
ncbi:hypothetical protein BDQ17DRAFT_1483898 [Cyathus striatus]|nr:hypothetical protein BDQ17DRAFT_1483898 [Cyathus striatus]